MKVVDALKAEIPSLFKLWRCARCREFAERMAGWDRAECQRRAGEIEQHLIRQAAGYGIPAKVAQPRARAMIKRAIEKADE